MNLVIVSTIDCDTGVGRPKGLRLGLVVDIESTEIYARVVIVNGAMAWKEQAM